MEQLQLSYGHPVTFRIQAFLLLLFTKQTKQEFGYFPRAQCNRMGLSDL